METSPRRVEVFVTGTAFCEQIVLLVRRVAADDCDIAVCNVQTPRCADRARALGLRSFPAVAVNGEVLPVGFEAAVRQMLTTVDWSETFKPS